MKRVWVHRGRYLDSVFLLRVGRSLEALPGVAHASAAMGTPANLEHLARVGFVLGDAQSAGATDARAPVPDLSAPVRPDDLVIAVEARDADALRDVEESLDLLLAARPSGGAAAESLPATLSDALREDPRANLALISVPGAYAAAETRRALRRGLHVMLFSDNVPVEDEIALKDEAVRRGLLLMGPDCGTAIVSGVPLGFANVARRGPVGIVGASGTGIQEIASLIDRMGGGISHALGTGGRDLTKAVGGRSMLAAIDALAADPGTRILVVVSKAPEVSVAERVLARLAQTQKPAVVQFVGSLPQEPRGLVVFADTLADAARRALELAGLPTPSPIGAHEAPFSAGRGPLRGLFCGGTLAQEAWVVLRRGGVDVRSNVAADPSHKVKAREDVAGNVVWDLGDDAFTAGRPHPMIEPSLRDEEVARAVADPTVGVVLVDCVLGYGAHADPAGSLAHAVGRAAEAGPAGERSVLAGRRPAVVASVTGTDRDPQGYRDQRRRLEEVGIRVAESNAQAAEWCAAFLVKHRGGEVAA